MIIIRNWRDVETTIAHESGIDWRLLSSSKKLAVTLNQNFNQNISVQNR